MWPWAHKSQLAEKFGNTALMEAFSGNTGSAKTFHPGWTVRGVRSDGRVGAGSYGMAQIREFDIVIATRLGNPLMPQ